MSRPGKFIALLATLRIANAPSVVSNVWLGYMVGWMIWAEPRFEHFPPAEWRSLALLSIAGVLLYFAGNLANDWFDREWDASRRPERSLPSGLFQPTTYLVAACLTGAAGVALAFSRNPACGVTSLAIAALIVIYTRFHKEAIWSVVPMGLCRAGLYFLGFLSCWPSFLSELPLRVELEGFNRGLQFLCRMLELPTAFAIGLFCYIAGLSLSARYEGMEDPPRGPRIVSFALIGMPVLAMSYRIVPNWPAFGPIGMLPFVIWLTLCVTRFRKPVPRYVSALLAGIPLVDFIAAGPLALVAMQVNRHARFPLEPADQLHLLVMIAVPLAAFVLGRLLQKVAPAT